MPKISVYVPDALALLLQDAKHLNVSAVCRRALIEELQQEEGAETNAVLLAARIETDFAALRAIVVTDALESRATG